MNEVFQAPAGRNMFAPLGFIAVMKMKKFFIIPFLLLSLSSVAQIDTAYLPPFAYLTYDTKEWEIEDSESDRYSSVNLIGKIDDAFELKIRLNLGDTIITKENLLAQLENRSPYGRKMIMQSFEEMGDYYLGVFNYSQDECSRNNIPLMLKSMKFRAAFRIIDRTNLLTIQIDEDSFFYSEELQSKKLQDIIKSIHVVTPEKIDKLLGYPLSKEKEAELIKKSYIKTYKEYLDFALSSSKCDDAFFSFALRNVVENSKIDSLTKHSSDSTLSDILARHHATIDSTDTGDEVRRKIEFGFNYTERTELLNKARNEAFSLDEYLDFQLSEAKEGPIQRLKCYVNLNYDFTDQNKYTDIIWRLFNEKYLPKHDISKIFFKKIGEYKYLMTVDAERRDTIYETFFFHLQKTKNSYVVTPIPLPQEIAEKTDKSFDKNFFVPNNNYDITITPSPNHQMLLLYKSKASKDYFPAFVSLGNSKDIKWIPVSSVDFDSSKFILIKRNFSLEFDFFSASNTDITWGQFDNNVEKERLNSIFNSDFGVSLDKATNINTRTEEWNANGLAMFVNEEISFNGSDVTISTKELIYFVQRNVQLDNLAYKIEGIEDINNDGNEDVYSILISNGKVIAAKAYIIKENSHELISTEEVVNLLNSNNGFQNLLLISQIGNHGENEVKSNSDLFNVTKE